jgi:hypothetical protein
MFAVGLKRGRSGAEKGSFRNSCNLERSGLKMGPYRSVNNRGWRTELECSLLVDGDAARREIELMSVKLALGNMETLKH